LFQLEEEQGFKNPIKHKDNRDKHNRDKHNRDKRNKEFLEEPQEGGL